jgi:hypothetical protein
MHNDVLSYGETFDQALQGIFGEGKPEPAIGRKGPLEETVSVEALIRRANEAFETYLGRLGDKKFGEAADALETLQKTLQRLQEE